MDGTLMLCVDVGTSSVKAACLELDGTIQATSDRPLTTSYPGADAAEQDPEALWLAVLEGCRNVLDEVERERVVGVAICSQYSSIVPVDNDARPTMNMLTWQDKRGAPSALRRRYSEARRAIRDNHLRQLRWLRTHGVPPLPSGIDSLGHMRFVRFARPEVYERTAAFLEPMDYVAARFTGRLASNPCSSFMSLLTDNVRGGWSDKLIGWSGIDRAKLPELLDVDEPVGAIRSDIADQLGLAPNTVVYGTMNDTHAGGMAAYAFDGEHAGLAIGTTGVIVAQVPFKRTDIRHAIVTTPSPVADVNFVLAENGLAGRAVTHFLDKLVFVEDEFATRPAASDRFAALQRAIEAVPAGAGGVLFLPWLTGSLTPSENARVRGGFLNVSLDTDRAALSRAVLEGVAFNFRWLLDTVERFRTPTYTPSAFLRWWSTVRHVGPDSRRRARAPDSRCWSAALRRVSRRWADRLSSSRGADARRLSPARGHPSGVRTRPRPHRPLRLYASPIRPRASTEPTDL